ncbi:MAG: DUF4332 domain-containing protein [Acidimicrobiales bacterium]
MVGIASIEGMGPALTGKLKGAGIRSTGQLLTKAGPAADRKKLAVKTGTSETVLLSWVQRSDLMRVKGVGEEFSDLLTHAGVTSAADLANTKPAELYASCLEIAQKDRTIVRRPPSEREVARWVEHARTLTPSAID